jgi:hypothetical protein
VPEKTKKKGGILSGGRCKKLGAASPSASSPPAALDA